MLRCARPGDLFDLYFDRSTDREIFDRVSRKCYFPSNRILLDQIDEHRRGRRRVKVAFSLSGVFLEQCERFSRDLLESFKELGQTGCVEFLDQPYYHSLASLFPSKDEFIEQVRLHHDALRSLLGFDAKVFENTELIYNNEIARVAKGLGYRAIFAEGAEKVLGWRSPNHVYEVKGIGIRLLLRNYRLSDDIGFRFSARWWSQWPLTADKYASWLAATPGHCIVVFMDYETFGEHHWPETGIHDFLRHLPREILKWEHLSMATPSEAVERHKPVGEIDIPPDRTTSWSGTERDLSSWLGNEAQRIFFARLIGLAPLVKESGSEDLVRIWRCLGISDHLHNMFGGEGARGAVHRYFSPFDSPLKAFVVSLTALLDLENRVSGLAMAADDPFQFRTEGGPTGVTAYSLRGFARAVKRAGIRSLEYHTKRGDFERWAHHSLHDGGLAKALKGLRLSGMVGDGLREAISRLAERRLRETTRRP